MNILIITPIYYPTSGGAAIYYKLLVKGLIATGRIKKITIITERVPGLPICENNDIEGVEVIRLFPHRAGGTMGKLSQYFRYAIQNILYIFVPYFVVRYKPDVVLIHSSFHNFINMLALYTRFISKRSPIIADVRDHQLPKKRLKQLRHYHALISSSLNISNHISYDGSLFKRTVHIPIIQDLQISNRLNASNTLNKYNLKKGKYLLFAGLLKVDKGVDLILQTYAELCQSGYDGNLVLVGIIKDENLLNRALKLDGVQSIGSLSHEELLDVMSCANIVVNLSKSEGMPRTSLEALSLGIKTILPQGIPEFDKYCPHLVASSSSPHLIARQIQDIIDNKVNEIYPLEQHAPEFVLQEYISLFEKVRNEFKSKVKYDKNN